MLFNVNIEFDLKFKKIVELLLNLKTMIKEITSGKGVIQDLKDNIPNLDTFIKQFEDYDIEANTLLTQANG